LNVFLSQSCTFFSTLPFSRSLTKVSAFFSQTTCASGYLRILNGASPSDIAWSSFTCDGPTAGPSIIVATVLPWTTMKRIGRCACPGCAGLRSRAIADRSLLRTSLNALALAPPPAAEGLGFGAVATALAAAALRLAT
jgi:hypothetical protein